MAQNLVIVESPAKSKTITKFLGKGYKVMASFGHVRDLPKSNLSIDVENDFTPVYEVTTDKKKVIRELKKEITPETVIWLATDEDREGEAIAWHLLSALKLKKDQIESTKRIVFHEITKTAVTNAIKNPREIDRGLVDAQQARRILDRLVGYKLSPLIWKKVKYGLSAGRVQSVATRLIVEREREIQAFKPEEYWSLEVELEGESKTPFKANLKEYKGKKADIKSEEQMNQLLQAIEGKDYKISKIEKKETKRNPAPPFITSTLQADISRKLGYGVKRTMSIAQKLYEGMDIPGKGPTGLITYMRTDSTNLAKEALVGIKEKVAAEYGPEYALDAPRSFGKKAKGAQEAHEAIRPTNFDLPPSKLKDILKPEEYKVYDIIWKRTLACQMKEAKLDKTAVDIEVGEAMLRATGQTIKFAGFLKAYVEDIDEDDKDKDDAKAPASEKFLPELVEGEMLKELGKEPQQHFTKPPARYTEASLVKKLESEGIGRPSTYAPTISTIMDRGYVEKQDKSLCPTDIAGTVNDFLTENFEDIVDLKFTANMEAKFDEIASGDRQWVPVIEEFYGPFIENVKDKDKSIAKGEVLDEKCGKCDANLVMKYGRRGKFIACSNYPDCDFTKQTDEEIEKEKKIKEIVGDIPPCDLCGKEMTIKQGKYGSFLGCSGYPECKNIKPINKKTGHTCPQCEKGNVIEKKTKKGKTFYGCDKYPDCEFAAWDLKRLEEKQEKTEK